MIDAILVTMSHDPTGTVITVIGELDMDTCPALRHATAAAAAHQAALHLDLTGVPFMDVTALHLLLDLHRDFQQRGVALHISGYQRQPKRLLTLTSSRHLLPVPSPQRLPPRSAWGCRAREPGQHPSRSGARLSGWGWAPAGTQPAAAAGPAPDRGGSASAPGRLARPG
ncbi:STAS domain-containing protein [Streptomyces sp. MS1.HAVA.3]|uniref:STAS domain-containing protein n=1 Tax=Streptomyces caledonius TaxID=3134107 RepID=A0ABU8UD33_9ACTN